MDCLLYINVCFPVNPVVQFIIDTDSWDVKSVDPDQLASLSRVKNFEKVLLTVYLLGWIW